VPENHTPAQSQDPLDQSGRNSDFRRDKSEPVTLKGNNNLANARSAKRRRDETVPGPRGRGKDPDKYGNGKDARGQGEIHNKEGYPLVGNSEEGVLAECFTLKKRRAQKKNLKVAKEGSMAATRREGQPSQS